MGQNRVADALQVAENALNADPENQQFASLRDTLKNQARR
jgi:hypothetical protein